MTVAISSALLAALIREAAAAAPLEACGLLFGESDRIDAVRSARNVAADPARHFEIDPATLIHALRAEREGGAAVIGYWHSHPGGVAAPSATDAAMAAGDGKLWLIVTGEHATAWRAAASGFEPVTLLLEA